MIVLILCMILSASNIYAEAVSKLSPEDRAALIARREAIRGWAITCPEPQYQGMYSHSEGHCHQGDATMFVGLSCLAATLADDTETAEARCRDVVAAQEPGGRWTRGPMWAGVDYAPWAPEASDFSRDQSRGVAAYLIAKGYVSEDLADNAEAKERGERWMNWVTTNGDVMCLEDEGSCRFRIGNTNLLYNALRHADALPPASTSDLVKSMYRSEWYLMKGFNAEVSLFSWIDPTFRDKWYPLHIKASSILMYRVMNIKPDGAVRNRHIARRLGKAARTLHRMDLDNPLYDFLRNGNRPHLVSEVLEKCPAEKNDGKWGGLHDWAWQRHTSEKAWERSDGHDAIYLINLMLAKDAGRLNW